MNVEKVAYAIRKLRRIRETLQPEQFDIGDWTRENWTKDGSCGFTACAIGWLLHEDSETQAYMGVTLVPTLDRRATSLAVIKDDGPPEADALCQYHIVASMFDIQTEQALHLFSPMGYWDLDPHKPTLTDVLDRFTVFFYMNGGTSEMLLDADQQVQQIVERALCDFEVYEEEPVSE